MQDTAAAGEAGVLAELKNQGCGPGSDIGTGGRRFLVTVWGLLTASPCRGCCQWPKPYGLPLRQELMSTLAGWLGCPRCSGVDTTELQTHPVWRGWASDAHTQVACETGTGRSLHWGKGWEVQFAEVTEQVRQGPAWGI